MTKRSVSTAGNIPNMPNIGAIRFSGRGIPVRPSTSLLAISKACAASVGAGTSASEGASWIDWSRCGAGYAAFTLHIRGPIQAARQALARPPAKPDISKLEELVASRGADIATWAPRARIEASMRQPMSRSHKK
jgi:hypothetical protein